MNDDDANSDEQQIKETWSRYWLQKKDIDEWDSLSEIIFQSLLRECGEVRNQRFLEAGCGTGRISARLASAGANVICLDISPQALAVAEQCMDPRNRASVQMTLGSILRLPELPACDVVWNAGVLEHFVPDDQRRSLEQFLGVLTPSGKVVILTPYSRSIPYRIAKRTLEGAGRWHYGRETPVSTLASVVPVHGRLEREYTIAFLPLIFDAYKFIPFLRLPLRLLWSSLRTILGVGGCAKLDKALSAVFGGYLLVSVIAGEPESL